MRSGTAIAVQPSLAGAIARIPLEFFVVWNGVDYVGQPGSIRDRALRLIAQPWVPVSLRALAQGADSASHDHPINPERVREAIRIHQGAKPAAYFLVRRTPDGAYVALRDIPWPADRSGPIRAGEVILDRNSRRPGQPDTPGTSDRRQ